MLNFCGFGWALPVDDCVQSLHRFSGAVQKRGFSAGFCSFFALLYSQLFFVFQSVSGGFYTVSSKPIKEKTT